MYMLRMRNMSRVILGALVMLSCTAASKADDFEKFREQAAARKKETIKMLTAERAPSVVTIEFVAKETFMGQEQKNEMEAPAVMVGPHGLVLTANSRLEGMMTMAMKMMGGMMGGMMPNMPKPQSDVQEIKVIIGDGSDEFEAKLVARDSDLDLAWVQIVDTKGKTFDYVDFNDSASLEVGDSYYTISRMGERFDRVPMVMSSSVVAAVQNPRPLLVGAASTAWGSPVFTAEGKAAGFLITQPPEEGEAGPMSLESVTTMAGFILPAKKVAKAIEQAKEIAKKQAAKEQEANLGNWKPDPNLPKPEITAKVEIVKEPERKKVSMKVSATEANGLTVHEVQFVLKYRSYNKKRRRYVYPKDMFTYKMIPKIEKGLAVWTTPIVESHLRDKAWEGTDDNWEVKIRSYNQYYKE